MAEIRDYTQSSFACENVQITWYDYDKFFKYVTEHPEATGQEITLAFHKAYCNSMNGSNLTLNASAINLENFDTFYTPFKDFAHQINLYIDNSPENVKAALQKMTPIHETTVLDLITFAKYISEVATDSPEMKEAADRLIEAWGTPQNQPKDFVLGN
jgi:hypothetical protein